MGELGRNIGCPNDRAKRRGTGEPRRCGGLEVGGTNGTWSYVTKGKKRKSTKPT